MEGKETVYAVNILQITHIKYIYTTKIDRLNKYINTLLRSSEIKIHVVSCHVDNSSASHVLAFFNCVDCNLLRCVMILDFFCV